MAPAALCAPRFFPTQTLVSPSPLLPSNPDSLSFPFSSLSPLPDGPYTPRRRLPLQRLLCIPPRTLSIPCTTAGLVLRELGLNGKEVQLLLLKHPQLEFSPPGSLRRRIVALHSVNITGAALHRTIARCPDILTSPEIDPFLDFVQKDLPELQRAKLERLLSSTQPQLFPGFIRRVQLLMDHGIPHEKLGHVLNNVNIHKVFFEKSLQEMEEMILFLECYGWPDLILRRPMLLNLDLNSQLIPRVEFLTVLGGGDEEAVAFLIGKLPAILSYTVNHFQSHLDFWRSVGLTGEQVFKIALVYPNVFSVSRERKLQPRIEFLKQCGFSAEDIFKFLIKAPLFLSLSFEENLSKKLGFLIKIGYRHRTRELAFAVGAATRTSCENMQLVIGVFFSYGFSCEDVLAMSKKHPQVLQYNHESLEKKVEFLTEGMEREIGELLVFPAFLGYKLDDRIKRRYAEKKEIRGKGMSLNKLLSVSAERFGSSCSSSDIKSNCDLDSLEV